MESGVYFEEGVPHVSLSVGVLKGKVELSRDGRSYSSFLGIRYATAKQRFAEAELFEGRWTGVKEAVDEGPLCTQVAFPPRPDGKLTVGEEDSFILNVHVPNTKDHGDGKGLPVMVWIHGGGFNNGSGDTYSPSYFMDEDVIIVNYNYRLGVFGFLSTGDEIIPGNLGMKDSIVALKWVQKNIKQFSGDPNNVTIFGESSGAVMTHLLLLSPMSKGLIHRVISQSGVATDNWVHTSKETAKELAKYFKASEYKTSADILKCLLSTPMNDLNEAQPKFQAGKGWPPGGHGMPFGPTSDPKSSNPFLPESSFAYLNGNGKLANVPWMVGMNEDECVAMAGFLLLNEKNVQELNTNWDKLAAKVFSFEDIVDADEHGIVAKKIKQFYFGDKEISKDTRKELVHLYSDVMFNYETWNAAKKTVGKGGPVYLYQFAEIPPTTLYQMSMPVTEEEKKMVGHADELIFLFGMEKMAKGFGISEEKLPLIKKRSSHEEFSRKMVKLWASFAKNGEPTYTWGTNPNKKWKPLSPGEVDGSTPLTWYRIDDNPGHVADPYKKRMEFWEQLYKDHFEKTLKTNPNK